MCMRKFATVTVPKAVDSWTHKKRQKQMYQQLNDSVYLDIRAYV